MNKIVNYIKGNRIISILFFVNLISGLVAFYLGGLKPFPDEQAYLLAAEGMAEGNFSSWYFLDESYPETLRTPGYSFFLLIFKSIYNSLFFIKTIQFILYSGTLLLGYRLVRNLSNNNEFASIIFLALTAINIQIPFYSGCISSEMPCVFLIMLFVYILLILKQNIKNAILLGLIAGGVFLIKPSFLLFPFLLAGYTLLFNRKELKYVLVHLVIFGLSLIPFSVWNYTTHGVFKPTPIEGGAGVAHMGYWSFKLPIGYQEQFYWGNVVVSDLTNPFFVSDEERGKNMWKFEKEWTDLLSGQQYLLSNSDRTNLAIMRSDSTPTIFPLYNSEFTIERDKKLWSLVIGKIKEDPLFYIKTRLYTFFRVYYTGFNTVKYQQQEGLVGKVKVIYPFVITFICILLGLILSVVYFIIKKGKINHGLKLLLLLSLYQGLVHVPFAIQSRFTVPIHSFILILVAVILSKLIRIKGEVNK